MLRSMEEKTWSEFDINAYLDQVTLDIVERLQAFARTLAAGERPVVDFRQTDNFQAVERFLAANFSDLGIRVDHVFSQSGAEDYRMALRSPQELRNEL